MPRYTPYAVTGDGSPDLPIRPVTWFVSALMYSMSEVDVPTSSASREKRPSAPAAAGSRPQLGFRIEAAGDDDPLDFAGAFIDLGHLRVAKQFLDGEVPHVDVPPEQLHRLSRDPHGGLRGEQL